MEEFIRFERRLALLALIVTVLASGALFAAGLSSWAIGVGLGGVVSSLNFRMMSQVARRQLPNTSNTRTTSSWVVLRFLMMGLALAVGAQQPGVEFFGVAAGLIVVQVCIILDQASGNRFTLGRPHGSKSAVSSE